MASKTATVPIVFKYTRGNERKTDKGGRGTLWKEAGRLFLITVSPVATYAELTADEKLVAVTVPQKRPGRNGITKLVYNNLIRDVDIPQWREYPYPAEGSVERPADAAGDANQFACGEYTFDVRKAPTLWYIDVTQQAWPKCMEYEPYEKSTMIISPGDVLHFGRQRRIGTGFLADVPYWRRPTDILGEHTHYPGYTSTQFKIQCPIQKPPTVDVAAGLATIIHVFPASTTLTLGRPPLFLINVNLKDSCHGWPLHTDHGKLIGFCCESIKTITMAQTNAVEGVEPGMWCVPCPLDMSLATEEQKQEYEASLQPKQPKQPKKKGAGAGKGKGKGKAKGKGKKR